MSRSPDPSTLSPHRLTSGGTVHTQTSNPALLALLRENSAAVDRITQSPPPPSHPQPTVIAADADASSHSSRKSPVINSGEAGADVDERDNSSPESAEPNHDLVSAGEVDPTSSKLPQKPSSADRPTSPQSPELLDYPPPPAGGVADPQPEARSISQTILREDPPEGSGERGVVYPGGPATPVSCFIPSETDSASSELARLLGSPSRKSFLLSAAIFEAGSSEEDKEEEDEGGYGEVTTDDQSGDSADQPDPSSQQDSGGHPSPPPGLPAAAAAATPAAGAASHPPPPPPAHPPAPSAANHLGAAAPSPDLTNPQHRRFVTPYVSRRLKDQPPGHRGSAASGATLRQRSGTGSALNVPKDQTWSEKQAARLKAEGGSEDPPQPTTTTTALTAAGGTAAIVQAQEDSDPDPVDSLDFAAEETPRSVQENPPLADQTAKADSEDDEDDNDDTRRSSRPVPLEKGTSNLSTLKPANPLPPQNPETSSQSEPNRSSGIVDQRRLGPNSTVVTPGGLETGAVPLWEQSGGPSPGGYGHSCTPPGSILKKGRGQGRAPSSGEPSVNRVYVDSPTFTREEEDEYRFVSSRVENHDDDDDDNNDDDDAATPTAHPTFRGLDQRAVDRLDRGTAVNSRTHGRPRFKQVRYREENRRYENRDAVLRHGQATAAAAADPETPKAPSLQFVLKPKSGSAEVGRGQGSHPPPPPVKSSALRPGLDVGEEEEELLAQERAYQQGLKGRVDSLQGGGTSQDTFVPRLTLHAESEDFRDSLDIPVDVELDSERDRLPRDSLDVGHNHHHHHHHLHLQRAMQDTHWGDPPTPPPGHHHPPPPRQGKFAPHRQGYGDDPPPPQPQRLLRGDPDLRQPHRQGYGDPANQGYADYGTQGYADPGTQGYADPGTQGYADSGRQGYADAPEQDYYAEGYPADPQRQGYSHQQRQARRDGYADSQRPPGYSHAQDQGYANHPQGYGDPQRERYPQEQGYASHPQGYGDPQRERYPQEHGYTNHQRYTDPEGLSGDQRQYGKAHRRGQAAPPQQGYANPQKQGYGNPQEHWEESGNSEDLEGYADSYRAGYGQGGRPGNKGYADPPQQKESYQAEPQGVGGYGNVQRATTQKKQEQRVPQQQGYRAGPQMLGYGDFPGDFPNGSYYADHPPDRLQDGQKAFPGSEDVTPRAATDQVIAGRQRRPPPPPPPTKTKTDPNQHQPHPAAFQGGYYAQETEPPSGAGFQPPRQPFPQDRKAQVYQQGGDYYAERIPPPQHKMYPEASPQDGYYLTEPRGYGQEPGYGQGYDPADLGHQSVSHAPQLNNNGGVHEGDVNSDRYKIEDGSSQSSTARDGSITLPRPEHDYIARNRVSFGRPQKHSYKKLHTLKKEEEEKLHPAQPKVKGRGQKVGSGSSTPARYPAIAENPEEGDGQGAEELWAHRSASLARAKVNGGKKRGSNVGVPSRNNGRLAATNNSSSSNSNNGTGSVTNGAQPPPPPPPPHGPHQLLPPAAVRAMPAQQAHHQRSPTQSSPLHHPHHHQMALAPVTSTQQLMTEDGQRISVDVNLRLISPPVGAQAEEGVAAGAAAVRAAGSNQRPPPGRQYRPLEKGGTGRQAGDELLSYEAPEGMDYPRGRYSADDVLSSRAMDGPLGEGHYTDDGQDYHGGGSYSTNPYKKIPPIRTTSEAPRSAPVQSEGSYMMSYLREKQKTQQRGDAGRPGYRVYGLRDYKRMQKEVRLGTLGPDLDNDTYKERRERFQRQMEYAKTVKDKNSRELPSKKPPAFPRLKETDDMLSKRRLAMEYSKHVPKPAVVKPRPSPYNNYEMASNLSPITTKPGSSQSEQPLGPEASSPLHHHHHHHHHQQQHEPSAADVLDLEKLHERHEQDKRNADLIRQKAHGVTS
ncbi:hypothetical protein ACOMHN_040179 [Nucella lapillus]